MMFGKHRASFGSLVRRLWPRQAAASRHHHLQADEPHGAGRHGPRGSVHGGSWQIPWWCMLLVLVGCLVAFHRHAWPEHVVVVAVPRPIDGGRTRCDRCAYDENHNQSPEDASIRGVPPSHPNLLYDQRAPHRIEVFKDDVDFALASMERLLPSVAASHQRRRDASPPAWMCPDTSGVFALSDAMFYPTPSKSLKGFTAFYQPRWQCPHPFVVMRLEGRLLWSSYGSAVCGLGLEKRPMAALDISKRHSAARCFALCAARRCCTAFRMGTPGGPHDDSGGGVVTCSLYRCIPHGTPRHLADGLTEVNGKTLYVLVSRRRPQTPRLPQPRGSEQSVGGHRLLAKAFGGGGVWHVVGFELPLPPQAEVVVVDAVGDVVHSAHGTLSVSMFLSEGGALVFTAMVPLSSGRARVAGAVAQAQRLVGQTIRVHLEAQLVAPSGAGAETSLLSTSLDVLVHRLSNAFGLVADAALLHGDAAHGVPSDNVRGIVHAAVCGAHLAFPNECCLKDALRAYHIHTDYDGVDASVPSALNRIAVLRIHGVAQATAQDTAPSCIALVDGFYTKFNASGVAVFDSIIVQNNCKPVEAAARDASSAVLLLQLEVANVAVATLNVSLQLLTDGCVAASSALPSPHGGTFDATATVPRSLPHAEGPAAAPILISVAVHRCKLCLTQLLCNIAAFVGPTPPCVVLHVSPRESGGTLSHEDVLDVLSWSTEDVGACRHQNGMPVNNKTLRVYVNTNPAVFRPNQYLHVVHMHNTAFMLNAHPQQLWSHVMWMQSNERIVKAGLAQYIQRFDVSRATVASSQAGLTRQHTPLVRMLTGDSLYREATHVQSLLLAPLRDANFASLLEKLQKSFPQSFRNSAGAVYPSSNVFSEGTFMNRTIAAQLSDVVLASFDTASACETEGIVHEYTTQLLLRVFCNDDSATTSFAHCGEKVSMLAWNNDDYAVSADDVTFVQCSPFEPPFSMKRFPQEDMAHPLLLRVQGPRLHNSSTGNIALLATRSQMPPHLCTDARKNAIHS